MRTTIPSLQLSFLHTSQTFLPRLSFARPGFCRITEVAPMLTVDQINDLHRLCWSARWPIRKIERHLRMSWRTIKKNLDASAQGPADHQRQSKFGPFKATIAEWLEKDPTVPARRCRNPGPWRQHSERARDSWRPGSGTASRPARRQGDRPETARARGGFAFPNKLPNND